MGAMQFGAVEAGLLRPHSRGDEIVAQLLDLGQGQRPRAGFRIVRRAVRRLADQLLGAAHAGVVQLNDRDGVEFLDLGRQSGEASQMLVAEHAQLARKALPHPLHVGGAGHGQAEAAFGAIGQPAELVVGEHAIGMALAVGQRRQGHAVLHGRATGEGHRCEQVGQGLRSINDCLNQPRVPRAARQCRGDGHKVKRRFTHMDDSTEIRLRDVFSWLRQIRLR